ncbi:3-phosphoshikimate 1-carboxyvinyltransferase [Oricola thermophila]|uniref:3-phosphoshikimate 1-carboxyvinyltransferase n=1 Tax=Oricola thermophila TaxID=2742145 RepID=A0A6N1VF91_9HYPH|nr:3-phosphoshikimate 1-carboxyvinyltransferase [Oricola thermophila]QKV19596.1 3-phosphoshikimate 1-carboxyvinyltransferase [Oricola thermophila]
MSLSAIPIPAAALPGAALSGAVRISGDGFVSGLSLVLAGVAAGETRISGLPESGDVLAIAAAMRALGADIRRDGDEWIAHGTGNGCLLEPGCPLDLVGSATGARMVAGLVGTYDMETAITGDESLRKLDMGSVLEPLRRMGVQIEAGGGDRLPARLHGPRTANPITCHLPVVSPDAKAALLLAGLNAPGITTVIEPEMSRDDVERMLAAFGADIAIETGGDGTRRVAITGQGELSGRDIAVPGDSLLAVCAIVAALVTHGSDVTLEGVPMNPARVGLLDTLLEMGAAIEVTNARRSCGLEVADLRVRSSDLKGVTVPAERVSGMIEDFPLLAVAASFADGETVMQGIEPLRVACGDRLDAVSRALEVNGVDFTEGRDSLSVHGRPGGRGVGAMTDGAVVETRFDPGIAMAFLAFGLAAEHGSRIDDASSITDRYPAFMTLFAGLGAQLEVDT